MLKINLGCGTNRLVGWKNHDEDVDITKALPWDDGAADFVFAEHVVEHISYFSAIAFFKECHRILHMDGVCRIAVPSVEQIWRYASPEYMKFTQKWVEPTGTSENSRRRDAMTNILFKHGHRAPWTRDLLLASLFYAGFDRVVALPPGQSSHADLQDIEGHGRVIGEYFNWIETVAVEATKLGDNNG